MKIILATVIVFLCINVNSQPSDRLELLDVYDLEYVSDPQISPDGKKILYVRNFKEIMTDKNLSNIWIINFDGSENRPITTGNQRDFAPQWSHGGNLIAYKSNRDEKVQIYLRWMDSGLETKLTNANQSPGSFNWSPDDQFIAFTMFVPMPEKPVIQMPPKPEGAKWNDPPKYIDELQYRADGAGYLESGNQHIFVISAMGGTPRQITHGEYNHGTPEWSKDGTKLYFAGNLREDSEYEPRNNEVYSVSLNDLQIDTLTSRNGPDYSPVVSTDGKKIAYLGFDDRYQGYQITNLYIMNADGTSPECVSCTFDRDVQNIQWDQDGTGIYFQYDELGDTKIGFTDLSGNFREVTKKLGGLSFGRPYNDGTFTLAKNGRYAFTLGGTDHPAELAAGEKGNDKRLTDLNEDIFQYKKLAEVEEFWFKSSFDQRDIQGWIAKPPDFDSNKKYPLLLEIHGGPFASYGSVWATEVQLYAASGYVVLYINPRGSTSYGEEFGNLIHHNYPSQDYDDLMSGVDAVIDRGYIDENNLYVTGGSGGGVLSSWIVGKTDRFRAAVVAKPVINWFSFALYADGPSFFSKYWFGEFPWENPEAYMKRSPISLVGNVSTPTMLLTGEEDYRTPIAESEQYYTALKLRKVDSALVRIPGASHGIAETPSNLIAKVSAVLTWFEKYRNQKP